MEIQELGARLLAALPMILLVDFARYAIIAALVYGLVWRVFGKRLAGRRIGDLPKPGQMAREFRHSMRTVLVFAASGALIFSSLQLGWTRVYTDAAERGWVWWWTSVAVLAVAHDTWFYWTHRLLHRPWWFARFHSVHHQSVHPTPWAAYSFHPVEAAIQALFYLIAVHVLPLHEAALFVFLVWMILRNTVGHCGHQLMPWRLSTRGPLRWLQTNTHHHLHHMRNRGNYALYFTWWDRWMDTLDHEGLAHGDARWLPGAQVAGGVR